MSDQIAERWAVAANVKAPGTKHFVAGAKVGVYGPWCGDGTETVRVRGRHRGGPRYVDLVMKIKHFEHFRPMLMRGPIAHGNWCWSPKDTKDEAALDAARLEKAAAFWSSSPDERRRLLAERDARRSA